jgi:hypothetical protein
MKELAKRKAKSLVENNLEYLDEIIESAIVNLLEDNRIDVQDNDFVLELQYIYDTYVGKEKYGKQLT